MQMSSFKLQREREQTAKQGSRLLSHSVWSSILLLLKVLLRLVIIAILLIQSHPFHLDEDISLFLLLRLRVCAASVTYEYVG